MMAIRREPNEGGLASLYDRPDPGIRLSPQTLIAVTAVAALYAGLGVLVINQKIEILPATFTTPKSIIIEQWKPQDQTIVRPEKVEKVPNTIRNPLAPPIPFPVEPIPATPVVDPVVTDTPLSAIPDAPVTTPTVGPLPPSPPGPAIIRNPNWVSKPSAAQLGRLYPERAARLGMKGAATLLCGVSATGSMVGCSVIDEMPRGWRFGEAALDSSRFFKMSPRTVDGQAVEGAKVRIPIVFNLTE